MGLVPCHAVVVSFRRTPHQWTALADGHSRQSELGASQARRIVGVISPWNWPLHLSARSVGPALSVGNAVVLKPARDTLVTGGLLLAKILGDAGLPPGLLNVVVGPGEEIGEAFVTHPAARVVSFTGSTPVGRKIAELASKATIIKRVDLELGGNDPFVVLDDADLDNAVEAAVWGKFLHQGQICIAINRIIVDERVHDDFLDRYVARTKALKLGNPDESNTVIGPISARVSVS